MTSGTTTTIGTGATQSTTTFVGTGGTVETGTVEITTGRATTMVNGTTETTTTTVGSSETVGTGTLTTVGSTATGGTGVTVATSETAGTGAVESTSGGTPSVGSGSSVTYANSSETTVSGSTVTLDVNTGTSVTVVTASTAATNSSMTISGSIGTSTAESAISSSATMTTSSVSSGGTIGSSSVGSTTLSVTSSGTSAVTSLSPTTTTSSSSTTTPSTPTNCTIREEIISDCMFNDDGNGGCNASTRGVETVQATYTCSNGTVYALLRNDSCVPTCTVTEVEFTTEPSAINQKMRVTPVSLPFLYQYTSEASTYKILWVTDKGFIALDKPLYAVEPSQNDLPDVPYIAPFWTNLVYVNETAIQSTIYTGLSNGTSEWDKVSDTILRLNKTKLNEELAVYRVVKIRWINLMTNINDSTLRNGTLKNENLVFDAYLINGPGRDYAVWDSYLRFEYAINASVITPNYQPVVIGYHTESATSHKSSVSFTNKITDFISTTNRSRTYFLSSKLLSTCEKWYWQKYTDILFKRSQNLTTVKRNPCPCSYRQALSDFRFYRLNTENRYETSNSISCFFPSNRFVPRFSTVKTYQQSCCYDSKEGSLITSGPFAGSVLDDATLESLRYSPQQPQRIKERDACCVASNGILDWSKGCYLYYEIRPASICDGYEPPSQGWFGGDPHIQTLSNKDYSCNIFGSFIYAETTNEANNTANSNISTSSTSLKALVSNELFSIVARTSKTPSRLRINEFFNQNITYFSSFSMYLGANNDLMIDVSSNAIDSYQFSVTYSVRNGPVQKNPFNSSNDFVEYFYYPTSSNNTTDITFSMIKDNEVITAIDWTAYSTNSNTNVTIEIEVPRLTISVWSGLGIQCYLITNNMACMLLLPKKYDGNVRGLAFGDSTIDGNQYCMNNSLVPNAVEQQSLQSSRVLSWFSTSASSSYRAYINNIACTMDQTSSTYRFCVQDTILSQSPSLGQVTVRSSSDYTTANLYLEKNPPKISLVLPRSINEPYTTVLTIPNTNTFQNQANAFINVTVDRNSSSLVVQLRETNASTPNDCIRRDSYYSCPFLYSNKTKSQLDITIIANDRTDQLVTYQKIQLLVNECVYGRPIWSNPTIVSSTVQVLFCVCNDLYTGNYCERKVGCNDVTACVLNFVAGTSCELMTNLNTTNSGQTPYRCVNKATGAPCSNNSECCQSRYEFSADVQQCLFRSVCNSTICGTDGICQNSELRSNGYFCTCNNDTQIFNGITCVQKKVCNAPSNSSGSLPCTGPFKIALDMGNQCVCQCRNGSTNTSGDCEPTPSIICNNTTDVCYDTSMPTDYFCRYRTQSYESTTNSCKDSLCSNYCVNGTCSSNLTSYTCSCPPGTQLDYALNCAPCDNGLAGPNCSLLCDCEFGECNVATDSESNKCICAEGYTGLRCDEYINYCDSKMDYCNATRTNRVCVLAPTNLDTNTTTRAFNCPCLTGFYSASDTGICQDIDECALASINENICPGSTTNCTNTIGSYVCDCVPGYVKDNSSNTGACVDLNECATGSPCVVFPNSYCVNLQPSYACRCNAGYAPDGDYNQLYAALKPNQRCQVYDPCAADGIICGGGNCSANSNSTVSTTPCYCINSLTLIQLSVGKYDCICPTDTHYYNGSICTVRPSGPGLTGGSTFILKLDCNNATTILAEIIKKFNETFPYPKNITTRSNGTDCDASGQTEVLIDINTDDNITVQNTVFQVLDDITKNLSISVSSVNKCKNQTVLVKNVTACFLLDLCDLCGGDVKRGVCVPQYGLSKCQCFSNTADPSSPYTGDFCYPVSVVPLSSPSSSRWTPIVIGVLAGLAGIFCSITCCLLALAAWRHRRRNPANEDDLRIRRIWHLPRAKVPATVTAENVRSYLESNTSSSIHAVSSIPENSTLDSDRSTYRTTYEYDGNATINSTFFKQLDQNMGSKLRATITRPDTNAVLSSLPPIAQSNSISSSSTIPSMTDDPIDELDAIIDDEDITATFHDPLDDLFQDNEMFEVINPNLKLPRPKMDSEPSGLFSFFN